MSEPALETPYEKGVNKWLIDQARPSIRKKLGTDYDPEKLVYLLGVVCESGPLRDDEVLDLAEMFIFLMENHLNWKLGAQVFRHYLNEGNQSGATLFVANSYLLSSPDFRKDCCISQWAVVERAIKERVSDTTGALFPRDRTTGEPKPGFVTDDMGQQIQIIPAPSPLRTGGTEVIYAETSVRITPLGETEIAATFNHIGVTSKITVQSTKLTDTSWEIEIKDWTSWGWDLADFNPSDKPNSPDIQFFPINVGTFFGAPWIEKKVTNILANQFDISLQCLDQLIGFDKYMLQLANRQFQRTNIVTGLTVHYFPRPFYARFAKWDFFAETASCGVPQKYTISEAAAVPAP